MTESGHKGEKAQRTAHLYGLAEAALADAAQAQQLKLVCGHQQVLRQGHVQVAAVALLRKQQMYGRCAAMEGRHVTSATGRQHVCIQS